MTMIANRIQTVYIGALVDDLAFADTYDRLRAAGIEPSWGGDLFGPDVDALLAAMCAVGLDGVEAIIADAFGVPRFEDVNEIPLLASASGVRG